MQTVQLSSTQVSNSMRARTADFFKMEVPRANSATPARDAKPLRRCLNPFDRMDSWESNENMCVALWALMSRS
ncbi:MAG: hypothetical protein HXX19_03730 [Rhodoferax sp.]|nr:hypothetical protein [Rhodoferax sp.]